MAIDENWIEIRVAEALDLHELVTEAVSSRVTEILRTQLTARQLTPKERKQLANTLLADMVPKPSDTEV